MRTTLLALALIAAPVSADLDRLSFLQGYWQAEAFGSTATEVWLPAEAGTMTGMFRAVLPNGRVVIEYITIEEKQGRTVMRWNHHNADHSRWESEPIVHELVELEEGYAVFEMAELVKGLPRNLIYVRNGEGYQVWVGDRHANSHEGAFELNFKRAAPQ